MLTLFGESDRSWPNRELARLHLAVLGWFLHQDDCLNANHFTWCARYFQHDTLHKCLYMLLVWVPLRGTSPHQPTTLEPLARGRDADDRPMCMNDRDLT